MRECDHEGTAALFDYSMEAELFSPSVRKSKHPPLGYKRFTCAADASRFTIEELSPQLLLGTCLTVDEFQYRGTDIRRLYDSADYPLVRAAVR